MTARFTAPRRSAGFDWVRFVTGVGAPTRENRSGERGQRFSVGFDWVRFVKRRAPSFPQMGQSRAAPARTGSVRAGSLLDANALLFVAEKSITPFETRNFRPGRQLSILAPEKTAEKRPKTDPKTTPNRPHFDPLMLHSAALNRRCRLRRCAWRLDTEPTTPQVSKCGVVRPDNFWKLLGLQAGSLSNVVVAEYDYAGNLHQPDPVEGRELTNEEKLQIASEVIDGKRPRSDLQKYGLHVGESHVLTTEEKQQFLKDIEAMEAATQPDHATTFPTTQSQP